MNSELETVGDDAKKSIFFTVFYGFSFRRSKTVCMNIVYIYVYRHNAHVKITDLRFLSC
jgi:hypothetical protein